MTDTPILPTLDYKKIQQNFIEELKNAAENRPSSLSYHRHQLAEKPVITEGIIQGIVIGGTNYITQTKMIAAENNKIIHTETGTLPIIADKNVLIQFIKDHYDSRAEALGINFGFAMEPIQNRYDAIDGKALYGTKEHSFSGLVGQTIGMVAQEAIGKDIPIAVANDTVCLALAGTGKEDASLIAGTGFNMGLRVTQGSTTMIVNLEAGNFDKFLHDEELHIIDAASEIPGAYLFEKVISGKYMATFFNAKAASLGISHSPLTTSQELSKLSHETLDTKANQLARAIMERSASLVATAIAGVYTYMGSPQSFTIIGEGSLLWLGWSYKENIQKQLHTLGVPDKAITIKHIADSSINGTFGLLIR